MLNGTLSRPTPRRILVVKLASLGDLLTATPALRALRHSFPRAHIAVLATPSSAAALDGLDSVDEVIPFDKFAYDRAREAAVALPDGIRFARQLRAGRWDALVLLHHLTTPFGVAKYAALALSSGAPIRAGLDNGRGRLFLTHRAADRGFGWQHEADYWLSVVATLGARHPARPRLELAIGGAHQAWAAEELERLGADGRERASGLALLVPGSGAFSVARRWAPERFAAVGRALREGHDLQPLVLAGVAEDERRLAHRLTDDIGPPARVVSAAPSPQALGGLMARCRLVIANDSGPVHVAAAVGTPMVAIFGPTNEAAWGPYPPGDERFHVVRQPLACAPCIHRGHEFGTPQGCAARTCLALVEPADVLAAAERALAAGGASTRVSDPAPGTPTPVGLAREA